MKIKSFTEKVKTQICCRSFLLLIALALSVSVASAQTAIPVSGGNASGEAGSLSYTVGQAFYTSVSGEGGVVGQGVQQTYLISEVTGTDNPVAGTLKLSVYPNPVGQFLVLDAGEAAYRGNPQMEYRLYDMNSRLLKAAAISGEKTTVDMDNLQPAVYFFKVMNQNLEIKSFKIIKK